MNPGLDQILADGVLAVGAGADTTASVLSNAFYFLLSNTEYYKRLQEEVDKYYPRGEDGLDPVHHGNMVLLDAVM